MIEGRYVQFRALEKEDLTKLRDWRNKKHIRKNTREYRLLNMFNQKNWFDSLRAEDPSKNIMFGIMNKTNQLIGVCGLTHIDWKNRQAEISIYLANENWQKKREAHDTINLMMTYAFHELNLHRLWAEIFSIATENIRLFESMKFFKEGILRDRLWRNGKWHNSYLYSKLAKEFFKSKDSLKKSDSS